MEIDGGGQPSPALERTEQYKMMILRWWEEIRELTKSVRAHSIETLSMIDAGVPADSIQANTAEQEDIADLISASLNLWEELEPKMKGKSADRFNSFKKYIDDPLKIQEDTVEVFALVRALRDALELLDITSLPVRE